MFPAPKTFRTQGRHGYSVAFSPFQAQRLACATSQHFGIAGGGTAFVFDVTEGGLSVAKAWNWKEGLFDITWSEASPNHCVTASGDGSIQVWDAGLPSQEPVKVLQEHTKEVSASKSNVTISMNRALQVYGVNWSLRRDAQLLVSASWDKTLKIWDVDRPQSLVTLAGHEGVVYAAVWSPLIQGCIASAAGDGSLRIWDMKNPHSAQMHLVFTGAVDGSLSGWDLRNPRQPICQLRGHQYAVKRIKCSPFDGNILLTSSYDFTVRVWDIKNPSLTPKETIEHHTEFVYGVDFNLHVPGQIADCSWDETVKVYHPQSLKNPMQPGKF